MYTDEIICIVLIVILIVILGANTVLSKSIWSSLFKKGFLYGTPIVAEEIARNLANGILVPMSEAGLLPANTTAATLL